MSDRDTFRAEQQEREPQHVFVVSGGKNGEFCSRCGLHWLDECHRRSPAFLEATHGE